MTSAATTVLARNKNATSLSARFLLQKSVKVIGKNGVRVMLFVEPAPDHVSDHASVVHQAVPDVKKTTLRPKSVKVMTR